MIFEKYSLFNILKEARKNKELIRAYFKGEICEGYHGDRCTEIIGMSVPAFSTLLFISAIIWIWALVVLILYWNDIPDWAKIIGLIGLFFPTFGPIISLIVIYVTKFSKNNK